MIRCIVMMGWLATAFETGTPAPPAAPVEDRMWLGGGFGLGFGEVDYVSVEPVVGVHVLPKLSLGGGVFYRYTKDSRYSPTYKTNDYGASVFARYRIHDPIFLQAQYEYMWYETSAGGFEGRDTYDSVLAGAGFDTPIGNRAWFFAMALYNFSYDDDDLRSPYSDAWTYRLGIGVGF